MNSHQRNKLQKKKEPNKIFRTENLKFKTNSLGNPMVFQWLGFSTSTVVAWVRSHKLHDVGKKKKISGGTLAECR